MTTSEEIVAAAKALPEETRLHIVDLLLASVESTDREIDGAWAVDLARREESLVTGEATLLTPDEVVEKARRRPEP